MGLFKRTLPTTVRSTAEGLEPELLNRVGRLSTGHLESTMEAVTADLQRAWDGERAARGAHDTDTEAFWSHLVESALVTAVLTHAEIVRRRTE